MFDKVSMFVKNYVERVLVESFGRIFWPPPSVSVLAFGENDDVLTLKLDGKHQLPGGIMNLGEDPKEAAKREVKEETGFDVEIHEILDIRVHRTGGFTIFFEGEVLGGEKSGSWEGKPEFVPKDEIKDRVWKLEHSHIHEYLFLDEN